MYSLTAESSLPLLILGVLHLLERDDTNAYFVTIIAVRNRWRYFSPGSVTTVCFRFEDTEHFRLNVYVFIVFGWFSFYVILRHATKKPLFSVEGVVVP